MKEPASKKIILLSTLSTASSLFYHPCRVPCVLSFSFTAVLPFEIECVVCSYAKMTFLFVEANKSEESKEDKQAFNNALGVYTKPESHKAQEAAKRE